MAELYPALLGVSSVVCLIVIKGHALWPRLRYCALLGAILILYTYRSFSVFSALLLLVAVGKDCKYK